MGQPAAKLGDRVVGTDIHLVLISTGPGPPIPTPLPNPFNGIIQVDCSPNVRIMGQPAATVGSKAINNPPHVPAGGPFAPPPPTNQGTIHMGSATVRINGKPAARNTDVVLTCNHPVPAPNGVIVATGTVRIG